jgi:hypothetical protein
MANSGQLPASSAQPEAVMSCCNKTNIRDCVCVRPQGPCTQPEVIFTHYDSECGCYSCQWVREARQPEIPDRLLQFGLVENPTYAGKQLDQVINTQKTGLCDALELVYPVPKKPNSKQWGWVFHPGNPQVPRYLSSGGEFPREAKMATLDSEGQWRAVSTGRCTTLLHKRVPREEAIYHHLGYQPDCSPCHGNDVLRKYAANHYNTTLAVGCINSNVSEQDLRYLFGHFGQIRYLNRAYTSQAHVQFVLRRDAMMAMRQLQGIPVYNIRLRLSWGNPCIRRQNDFPPRAEGTALPFKGNASMARPLVPEHGRAQCARLEQERQQTHDDIASTSSSCQAGVFTGDSPAEETTQQTSAEAEDVPPEEWDEVLDPSSQAPLRHNVSAPPPAATGVYEYIGYFVRSG